MPETADDRASGVLDPRHPAPGHDLPPRRAIAAPKGRGERAGVDLVVPLGEEPGDDAARQVGLPLQHLVRRQPARSEALGALHGEEALEVAVLIAVESDPQGPLGPEPAGAARQVLDARDELRVAREAVELEVDERPLGQVRLGRRREHAGRRVRRDAREIAAVEDEHLAGRAAPSS